MDLVDAPPGGGATVVAGQHRHALDPASPRARHHRGRIGAQLVVHSDRTEHTPSVLDGHHGAAGFFKPSDLAL